MSLGMFSIIPVPKDSWDESYMPIILPALPLVGALIGFSWYGLAYALALSPVPVMLQSAIILFIPFFLSGFIHIDGYMDTADAVFSRRNLDEKKIILKDPHTGAFAVVAAATLFITQFSAVYSVMETQKNLLILAFIPVISRCCAAGAILNLKPVFDAGYGASFKSGTKPRHSLFICILAAIYITAAWFKLGIAALPLIVAAFTGVIASAFLYKQFHGISGDLSGCVISVSECAALLCMAIL